MAKKSTKSDGQKKAEKVYKKAKKTAKKHGKLRQFNIAVAILLTLALIAGLVYYFVFYEPKTTTIVEGLPDLEVHYINVGQADSILIKLPDGKNMLIDAGGTGTYREHLEDYLKKEKIKTIDYALLTHADADHVESFDYVLDWCEVKNVYMPKLYPSYNLDKGNNRYESLIGDRKNGLISTKEYYDFCTRVDDETYVENGSVHSAKVFANEGYRQIVGTGYEIEIYSMPSSTYDKVFNDAAEKNEISPTVLLKCQGIQFLFTGDGIGTSHNNFLKEYSKRNPLVDPDFDVYKAAHHGSSTHGSNYDEFLKEIETEYTVISVNEGEYNDVPSKTVMANMEKYGNKIYRTDKYGDVVFGVRDSKLYTPEQMAA